MDAMRGLKMSEQNLTEEIISRCNEYALVTRMQSANVAYVPSYMYDKEIKEGRISHDIWSAKNGEIKILNSIHVFIKDNLNCVCVTYMKNPKDEMPENVEPDEEPPKFLHFASTRLGVRVKLSDIQGYHVQSNGQSKTIYIKMATLRDSISVMGSGDEVDRWCRILDKYLAVKVV
jgi:hypothetical protein